MKKKLLLFINDKVILKSSKAELEYFFENILDIEVYSLDEYIKPHSVEGDLVLTISPISSQKIQECLKYDIEIIRGNRTILHESYELLKALPMGTRALIVSSNNFATFDFSTFLMKLEIPNVEFFPIYKEMTEFPKADIVIMPLELNMDLDFGDIRQLNLNARRITPETYKVIMYTLNLHSPYLDRKIYENLNKLVALEITDVSMFKICALEEIFRNMLQTIEDGVLVLDEKNKVIYINQPMIQIFDNDSETAEFEYLDEKIIPKELFDKIAEDEESENQIFNYKNKKSIFSKKIIHLMDNKKRYLIVLKDITKIQALEAEIRRRTNQSGYVAKYYFKDILGNSAILTKTIEQAKKIANVNRTTLILGESGTGKEMFAQAMHNCSKRKNNPFIAVNCAAMTAELLESELFGYESGTFTGALKGGKKGLFELAHGGTLFLDEMGDLPPTMQTKLLRVLQEGEIRRIGGEGIIPVNVWTIAATNCDLEQLVNNGSFRLDLYHRLNIFTLMVPTLRERYGDAEILINHWLCSLNDKENLCKEIDKTLLSILTTNEWTGNVRELLNTVEYSYYMGSNLLNMDDLPLRFIKKLSANTNPVQNQENDIFFAYNKQDAQIIKFMLKLFNYRKLGRRGMNTLLLENGIAISDYKLRNFLKFMTEKDLITYQHGKQGGEITEKGILICNLSDNG